jgi:hypothetical protein
MSLLTENLSVITLFFSPCKMPSYRALYTVTEFAKTVHLVLRPLLAYCTSPSWYMMVIVEQLVELRLAGDTEVLGENVPQRHFAHHKSHITRRRLEAGPPAAVGSQRLTAWAMARPMWT